MRKVIALISGGKDSFYTIKKILDDKNNEIIGLLHIRSNKKEFQDSYMFQTVGSEIIEAYGECMEIPVYIYESGMNTINTEMEYKQTKNDEVEDLFNALSDLKSKIFFDSVCSGAILSNYQKKRVENVCERLNLRSLTPLWEKNQKDLIKEISSSIEAVIIKTATPSLNRKNIHMNLKELLKLEIKDKYFNWCGEGGEYETLTLDAPFFLKKIKISEYAIEMHPEEKEKEDNVFFLKIKNFEIIKK